MQRTKFNSKAQKQNHLAPKYLKLADDMAWKHHRKTGLPFEDLQAVARVALCSSIDIWTIERAALSTLAYHCINNALTTYTTKSYKHTPKEAHDYSGGYCPARQYEFMDSIKQLSADAREVVKTILSAPGDILGVTPNASPCQIKKALRDKLKNDGVSSAKVTGIFSEISNILH